MRRIFAIFAAFLLIAMCGGKAYAEGENAGNEGVSGYVLMEVSTGTVLEEYCPDVPVNIGYLTKLMTLILVAEDLETGKISPDTVLTASQSVSGTKGAVICSEALSSATPTMRRSSWRRDANSPSRTSSAA